MSFDFSTLVTDRTQADVNRVKQIAEKIKDGTASESELAEFNSAAMKGAYNYTDLNRVTAAMEALKAKLEGYGYAVPGYQRIKVPHVFSEPEPTSRLPEGYTELTYIESTGTQYIDTSVSPTTSLKTVIEMTPLSGGMTSHAILGSTWATNGYFMMFNNSVLRWHSRDAIKDVTVFHTNSRNTIEASPTNLVVNGTTYAMAGTGTDSTNPIFLFWVAVNTPYGTPGVYRLHSCQIYDNGTIVRDYVPCINPSGDVGLYDLVTRTFYGNAGTGVFVAGETVEAAIAAVANAVDETEYDQYTWYEFDWPTPETMTVYLLNVSVIRSVLEVMASTPKVPSDMVEFMARDANDIETILLDVYRQLVIMPTTFIPCGEALCGGDNL